MDLENIPQTIDLETVVVTTQAIIYRLLSQNPSATVADLENEIAYLIEQAPIAKRDLYKAVLTESQKYNKDKTQSLAGLAVE